MWQLEKVASVWIESQVRFGNMPNSAVLVGVENLQSNIWIWDCKCTPDLTLFDVGTGVGVWERRTLETEIEIGDGISKITHSWVAVEVGK